MLTSSIQITPVGGLGEVGRNMTVFTTNGRSLIVDCGVLFPDDTQTGVDVILPDLRVLDRLGHVVGVFLTHGHEDHIGGVPHLLRAIGDVPVYGSRLTLALLAPKLVEFGVSATLVTVEERDTACVGPFDLRFFAVNHSIPDGLAVAITTAAGTVLHTGDFKLDQTPLDNRITDLRGLALLAEEGIDVLLVDSTNADVPGFGITERDLAPAIDRVFAATAGRVVVSSFASHIHRIQQVIDAAARHERHVVYYGRSMERNMAIAQRLGYLNVPPDVLVSKKEARTLPADKLTLICTGSQGEPLAALARMARDEHEISLVAGDTVLLASSLVPGNEHAVGNVINDLIDRGAAVVHKGTARVHVSGHATAGELQYVYNILRPRTVVPVHGENRHLAANAAIAVQTGTDASDVFVLRNGHSLVLEDGGVRRSEVFELQDLVVVDGKISDDALRALTQRQQLAAAGMVVVLGIVQPAGASLAEPLEVQPIGVDHASDWTWRLADAITERLLTSMRTGITDLAQLEHTAQSAADRWLQKTFSSAPACRVLLVEDHPDEVQSNADGMGLRR